MTNVDAAGIVDDRIGGMLGVELLVKLPGPHPLIGKVVLAD
jgi:hypothetical protein